MDLPVVIDSHHPDDRLGLAVPSHHHHPGTDAGGVTGVAQRGPAESLIVFVVKAATKSMRASIKVPPLTRLRVVVGVRHDPVRAADKSPEYLACRLTPLSQITWRTSVAHHPTEDKTRRHGA